MKTFFHQIIGLIFAVLAFTSCKKGELPVSKPDSSAFSTISVVTGPTYDRQVYFNLSTGQEVGTSHRADWDLGFSCSGTPHIVCNTSKMMTAMRVEGLTFEQLNSKGDFENQKQIDHNSGNIDSLAIRGGTLFLIDRGSGIDVEKGFIKLEIIEHSQTVFKGRIANLDGTNEQMISISKKPDYNFVYLKWNKTGAYSTPTVEPKKTEWDLAFRQYGYVFYVPAMFYSVMGVLTNTYNTKAFLIADENMKFEDVNLAYAQTLTLSDDIDIIGYNWKVFSFDPPPSGSYQVADSRTYIVQDQNDIYYKIRFISFQHPITGEKGTPVFEYATLF